MVTWSFKAWRSSRSCNAAAGGYRLKFRVLLRSLQMACRGRNTAGAFGLAITLVSRSDPLFYFLTGRSALAHARDLLPGQNCLMNQALKH
jgi:hypothetical protein